MESLNGLLMHLSIGCTMDVHPPGMITTSALHSRCSLETGPPPSGQLRACLHAGYSRCAISMLAAAWCGL